MIFRQLFDSVSSTYTYLLASRRGGEALIIDPVLEKVDRYLQLLQELDLKLVKAVDTHLHADHITGLGALRDRTRCITVMGEQSSVDVVSMRVAEGDTLEIEGLSLDVLYTPGHTDDSYSFLMADRVFTGDTLLIRGTGRTDFQNGDPRAQYESIFGRLLKLPDETLVYPGARLQGRHGQHDRRGEAPSIRACRSNRCEEYVDADGRASNLPNPKMMDVAVPANMQSGLSQEEIARRGWAVLPREAMRAARTPDVALVDLRETARAREAWRASRARCTRPTPTLQTISAGRHAARAGQRHRQAAGVLLRLRRALGHGGAGGPGRRHRPACHIEGGIDAWKKAGGPTVAPGS